MEEQKTKIKKTSGIIEWFRELRKEFNKISWPNGKTVAGHTMFVIIIAFILGIIIAVLDFVFQYGIDFLVNLTL